MFSRSIYILQMQIENDDDEKNSRVVCLILLIPQRHVNCFVSDDVWLLLEVNEAENQHWCAFHNDDNAERENKIWISI